MKELVLALIIVYMNLDIYLINYGSEFRGTDSYFNTTQIVFLDNNPAKIPLTGRDELKHFFSYSKIEENDMDAYDFAMMQPRYQYGSDEKVEHMKKQYVSFIGTY
jgi:hypothetical protein